MQQVHLGIHLFIQQMFIEESVGMPGTLLGIKYWLEARIQP